MSDVYLNMYYFKICGPVDVARKKKKKKSVKQKNIDRNLLSVKMFIIKLKIEITFKTVTGSFVQSGLYFE